VGDTCVTSNSAVGMNGGTFDLQSIWVPGVIGSLYGGYCAAGVSLSYPGVQVPEPNDWSLMLIGVGFVGGVDRNFRRVSAV
jgi:hypothetical protein